MSEVIISEDGFLVDPDPTGWDSMYSTPEDYEFWDLLDDMTAEAGNEAAENALEGSLQGLPSEYGILALIVLILTLIGLVYVVRKVAK